MNFFFPKLSPYQRANAPQHPRKTRLFLNFFYSTPRCVPRTHPTNSTYLPSSINHQFPPNSRAIAQHPGALPGPATSYQLRATSCSAPLHLSVPALRSSLRFRLSVRSPNGTLRATSYELRATNYIPINHEPLTINYRFHAHTFQNCYGRMAADGREFTCLSPLTVIHS
jgi:hypothetical protein